MPVTVTPTAAREISAIIKQQELDLNKVRLRVGVKGGGCSGFSYSMAFENQPNMLDKTYNYDGLKVYVDQASMLYLDGAEVDFVDTVTGGGFTIKNPNATSTCGCGSSFSV